MTGTLAALEIAHTKEGDSTRMGAVMYPEAWDRGEDSGEVWLLLRGNRSVSDAQRLPNAFISIS